MVLKIRRIIAKDLPWISKLFEKKRSNEELEWTYLHSDSEGKYNSLVAETESGEVVGVISFIISTYVYNGKKYEGLIPMGWQVRADHRGLTGIRLMRDAMKLTEFGITIGGTEKAVVSQRAVGLRYITEAKYFYKSVSLIKYMLERRYISPPEFLILLNGKLKSLLFYGRKRMGIFVESIALKKLDLTNFVPNSEVFYNHLDENRINWLLSCPLVRSYLLEIKLDNKIIGYAICYINREQGKEFRGRIVHISYLGKDMKVWRDTLLHIEIFMRSVGCFYLTSFTTHPWMESVMYKAGFSSGKKTIPVFKKDMDKHLESIRTEHWYLSFAEADNACRDI